MYEGKHFNERVRQISFLLIIVFLAGLIITELQYFASAILGGFTIFMILRKPYAYLRKKGWKNSLATIFLLLVTFVVLILLLGGLLTFLYEKVKSFGPHVVMDTLKDLHGTVLQRWGYDIFSADMVQKALGSVGNVLPTLLSMTGNVIANIVMMMFVLYFLLVQSVQFERQVDSYIPLSLHSIQILKASVHSIVINNAVGIPLIMLGQAALAGLAYWVLDAGDPIIWGLMTAVFGLVPVIGTAGIWVPLSIELFVEGHIWQGIVLLIYGGGVISSVDNVIRMVFLKKKANIHPLITLFGVIMGINLFGFWGIIFGPLLISGLFLLIRIYNMEFSSKNSNPES